MSVRTDDTRATEAQAILDRSGGVDAEARGRIYREEGWTQFDERTPNNIAEPLAHARNR